MPSKNMLRKGKRRQTVKPAYRAHRDALQAAQHDAHSAPAVESDEALVQTAMPEGEVALPNAGAALAIPVLDELEAEDGVRSFPADAAAKGKRLDAYLAKALPDISRARVQLLIDHRQVQVNGEVAKASLKLEGGERIEIEGEPHVVPLKAEPEDIPLAIVYEDGDLAVIDKPAGMNVHAGAGDAEHNRGTLVNALLFHFGKELSETGGALRPGIVHRLDKDTSGLILVAKNDVAHRKLGEMFAAHALRKVYVALVHGIVAKDEGTIDLPIGRDPVKRVRMTAKRSVEAGARPAVSHWRVLQRIGSVSEPGPLGAFTLVEVEIETGRTHQIRVHLAALGHPVVGDTLYGAPARLRGPQVANASPTGVAVRKKGGARHKEGAAEAANEATLARNFLHAAELDLPHPRTRKQLKLRAELPEELRAFIRHVGGMDPGR